MFYLRQNYKLTARLQKTLRRQNIDESGPGTIRPDFYQLLNFIGEHGIPVTGTHLLPLKLLKPLNAQLSRPIELGLKRPQQKSYPHLNGLYLLLRTTGLGQVDSKGPKPHLIPDREILPVWASLNPTEQYFTLFETWLVRGRGEVLGERGGYFWSDAPIIGWAHFFDQIPAGGLQIAGNRDAEDRLRYWPKLHNLALLELFGLLTIQPGSPLPGQGWQIDRVWRTPLGDALLAVVAKYIQDNFDEIFYYDDPSEIPFGVLQPVLQPYFPQWQENLTFPALEFRDGLYIFKVSWSKVWRRIAIPADLTLNHLSAIILHAYEFDFDHLYRFTYTNRFGAPKHISHPYLEESPSTDEILIGDLPLQPGASLEFIYDFGDWWDFEVTLEKIEPPDPKVTEPEILEKHGRPPEQYGW